MDIIKLYEMQKQLDAHIVANHQLENENLLERKILALLVELGELANETRCFKFWSLKPPAATQTILEEFVDGLHFILSIGLDCGYEHQEHHFTTPSQQDLTGQFLKIYECISKLKETKSFQDYQALFNEFLSLGQSLGFSHEDLEQAYIMKNDVNYERQENGY